MAGAAYTVHLQYVTPDDLAELVSNGERFVVRDAESGEDLTRTFSTPCSNA